MKKFLKFAGVGISAVAFLASIIGIVYLGEFTSTPRFILHLLALVFAAAFTGVITVVDKAERGDDMANAVTSSAEGQGPRVSLTIVVFIIMAVALNGAALLAFNER